MAKDKLPSGVELTPIDETFRNNPYAVLKRLRDQAPVYKDDGLIRYVYTQHDVVRDILRDNSLWSDPRKAKPGTFTREFLGGNTDEEPSMLLMDEPDHRRLRSLVSGSFTPGAVERWRTRAADVVQRVLDEISGEEFDLIAEFAGPIPTVVIAELLGIDATKHKDFKAWSDAGVTTAFNPFATEEEKRSAESARENLRQFFVDELKARRQNPGDDLISDMIRAETQGEKLTEDEIISQCNLLLVAGNVTTTDLIGNGVKALLDNPDQLQALKADPSLIQNAVEEMLRFDSPVSNSGRIANRSMSPGGCPVETGDSLSTSLAAANRDPAVYPDPDRFDIKREDTHHQSFGGGRHLCLGAHLARLEAQEAINGLLGRFDEIEKSEKGHVYAAIPSFRGMSEFWVRAR